MREKLSDLSMPKPQIATVAVFLKNSHRSDRKDSSADRAQFLLGIRRVKSLAMEICNFKSRNISLFKSVPEIAAISSLQFAIAIARVAPFPRTQSWTFTIPDFTRVMPISHISDYADLSMMLSKTG